MTSITKPACSEAKASQSAGSRKTAILNFATNPWLHVIILLAIVWSCFARTLGSYFLADDFSEVHYVSKILNGSAHLIWANFTGPYMQNPSIHVFRPWMLMTQVIDYAIWRANAFGFYLSNLLYYTGDVVLCYLIVRQLTATWTRGRSALTALISAALFAASPLHCESVSWVVGRVDVDCCFYYLLSLQLFLLSRSSKRILYTTLSIVSFWLALFTKEMAVGLPVVITAIACLWTATLQSSFPKRWFDACKWSVPYWASLAAYFVLRYLAIGTILGGYTGGVGASQDASAFMRWFDPDIISRLFFPFSAAVFPAHNIYAQALSICYTVLLAIAALRLLSGQLSYRWFLFFSVWIISAVLPIYRLWGLGFNLEGSRFYFFLSLSIAIFWPIVILQPNRNAADHSTNRLDYKLATIGSIALLAMLFISCRSAYATNVLWVHAGKEVRDFSQQCQKLAQSLLPGQQALLLGIPEDHGGAHQILNGHTFRMMLRPPYTETSIFNRFLVFNPFFFGPGDLINTSRFKQSLSNPEVVGPLVWDKDTHRFNAVSLKSGSVQAPVTINKVAASNVWQSHSTGHAVFSEHDGTIVLSKTKEGDGLAINGLNLDPLSVDFLEFDIAYPRQTLQATATVGWNGEESIATFPIDVRPEQSNPNFKRVRLQLSHWWRWFTSGPIHSLVVQLSPAEKIEIKNLEFSRAEDLAPQVDLQDLTASTIGVYRLPSSPIKVAIKATRIPQANSVELEISKSNYFFDNFKLPDQQAAIANKLKLQAASGVTVLDSRYFPSPGLYQIRGHCLDRNGNPIGEYSDLVTVER